MPAHLLKPHPDIGLDMFDQMAYMDGPVCVGQRARNQYFSYIFRRHFFALKTK